MAGAQSARSGPGLIAFTRYDGIYVMRADGSGVRPLRRGGVAAGAFALAWSRDGTRLAFGGYEAGKPGIWVMSANGTSLVRLVVADGVHSAIMSPTWSPDGRTIAYTAFKDGDRDIWAIDVDGGDERRLATTPGRFEIEVDWSPVGARLVFSSDGYFPHIYAMNTTGGGLRSLTPRGLEALSPRWSPNGRRIAFVRYKSSERSEIYVTNPAGRKRVQLTQNARDQQPSWSPDGQKIAFLRGGPTCLNCGSPKLADTEVYVMNVDGTGVTRLTHNKTGEGFPAWQPVAAP